MRPIDADALKAKYEQIKTDSASRTAEGGGVMFDKIIIWLIKKLIFLWDRQGDKMVLSFGRDERTDYSVLVDRFYDNYWTSGTSTLPYNSQKEVE